MKLLAWIIVNIAFPIRHPIVWWRSRQLIAELAHDIEPCLSPKPGISLTSISPSQFYAISRNASEDQLARIMVAYPSWKVFEAHWRAHEKLYSR